jgi:hypothetical protein
MRCAVDYNIGQLQSQFGTARHSTGRLCRNHLAMDRRSLPSSDDTPNHQIGLQPGSKATAGALLFRTEVFREANENPRASRNRDQGSLWRRSGMSGRSIANPIPQDTESESTDCDESQNPREGASHKMSPDAREIRETHSSLT